VETLASIGIFGENMKILACKEKLRLDVFLSTMKISAVLKRNFEWKYFCPVADLMKMKIKAI